MSVCGKNVCRLQERCIHQAQNMRLFVQAPAEESLQDSSEAPTRPEEFLRYEHNTPGPEMQPAAWLHEHGQQFHIATQSGSFEPTAPEYPQQDYQKASYPKVHF